MFLCLKSEGSVESKEGQHIILGVRWDQKVIVIVIVDRVLLAFL